MPDDRPAWSLIDTAYQTYLRWAGIPIEYDVATDRVTPSSTTVTSSANPAYGGDTVTLTATVTGAPEPHGPTGTVKLAFQPAYALFSPSAGYRD